MARIARDLTQRLNALDTLEVMVEPWEIRKKLTYWREQKRVLDRGYDSRNLSRKLERLNMRELAAFSIEGNGHRRLVLKENGHTCVCAYLRPKCARDLGPDR